MRPRWFRDAATVLLVVGLLSATYVLPPDTSLRLVRENGLLRVCVPPEYPPLVTQDPGRPGIDMEILERVAQDIGVRLGTSQNSAIGRDFNPRNWRITRAQCHVLAGGIVATGITASFLETTPPHLETGWAIVVPSAERAPPLSESRVGFVPGVTGLDRIALSGFLRERAASTTLYSDRERAADAVAAGDVDALATEALLARRIAEERGWSAFYLPDPLQRYPLAFGLWKGDLTLKRAIVRAIEDLRASGELERIRERYDVGTILGRCPVCE